MYNPLRGTGKAQQGEERACLGRLEGFMVGAQLGGLGLGLFLDLVELGLQLRVQVHLPLPGRPLHVLVQLGLRCNSNVILGARVPPRCQVQHKDWHSLVADVCAGGTDRADDGMRGAMSLLGIEVSFSMVAISFTNARTVYVLLSRPWMVKVQECMPCLLGRCFWSAECPHRL